MIKSPRLLAFDILYQIHSDNSYSNLVLAGALDSQDLSRLDKSFISLLIYGVCERQMTLNYYIKKYLTSKPKPKILVILQMGAYQLLFMDKVPSSAAINESVKLCKDIKQDFYTGLVNSVLHKIDSDSQKIDDLDLPLKYSVPNNLIRMWQKAYGEDKVNEFLPYVNGGAPTYAVPNPLYVTADELLYELNCEDIQGEVQGDLVLIESGFNVAQSEAYKRGLFHVQDKACYDSCKALGAKEGMTVIDMCASPGGKTFTLAGIMGNKGSIVSCDLYENRVSLINKGASAMGFDIVSVKVNDASIHNDDMPMADRIICDVPCSGFGIISKKPEIRYKELDSIKDLPKLQLQILQQSSSYLKVGGRIIYSTCTLNKKENEKVTSSFLSSNNNFKVVDEKTFFPCKENDGFYYAVLERTSE